MNGEEEVTNGTRLPLGTVLSVNAEVTSDDYIIRAILVNGEELESNTLCWQKMPLFHWIL